MKTKSALVIEWCEKNKIVDLIVPYRGDIYSYKLAEATTDEDAKLLIGGFDDEQNYHKLPDDIFKVKVMKRREGYVTKAGYDTLINSENIKDESEDDFTCIHYYPVIKYHKKVTIFWEDEEVIK